jgi:hypothetical protein
MAHVESHNKQDLGPFWSEWLFGTSPTLDELRRLHVGRPVRRTTRVVGSWYSRRIPWWRGQPPAVDDQHLALYVPCDRYLLERLGGYHSARAPAAVRQTHHAMDSAYRGVGRRRDPHPAGCGGFAGRWHLRTHLVAVVLGRGTSVQCGGVVRSCLQIGNAETRLWLTLCRPTMEPGRAVQRGVAPDSPLLEERPTVPVARSRS